jgi:AraC family transcriptional regulator
VVVAVIDRETGTPRPTMVQRLTTHEVTQVAPTGARHPDAPKVTAYMGGELKALGTGAPEFSSVASKWSGFLFERHTVSGSLEEIGWFWHSTHVGMCTSGSSVVRVSGGAGEAHCVIRPGSVFIFPRGCDETNIRITGDVHRFVVTEFDLATLERLLPPEARPSDESLVPQLNMEDPHIAAILSNMLSEATAGCPSGPLYGESLSLALAAYVTGRYSAKACKPEAAEHGFSRAQLQSVIDYIHAHLRGDVSLVELANAIHLSPRHFSRLFRKTFGTTPHRYVMDERVSEVKSLLASRRFSILEIVEELGFSDQSHLTNVFRKATGVTPARYQRDC